MRFKAFVLFLYIFSPKILLALAPTEPQREKYTIVPFFSGRYQNFAGASSFWGLYGFRKLSSQRATPNVFSLGFKAGSVDENFDQMAWFVKREISWSDNFFWTVKYNHSIYKTYELAENSFSTLLNFQGFFNNTNLFYMSFGMYYRVLALGKNYAIPLNVSYEGQELFFLINVGYKHFGDSGDAISIDINNYNDFHVFNFNNLALEISFSSYFTEQCFYLITAEIRTSGFLVGVGSVNEERVLLGLGYHF